MSVCVSTGSHSVVCFHRESLCLCVFPQGVIVSVVFSQGVIVSVCVPQGVIVYEVVGVAPAPSYFHLNTTTGVISPRVDLMVDTTQNYVVSVGGQSVATTQN